MHSYGLGNTGEDYDQGRYVALGTRRDDQCEDYGMVKLGDATNLSYYHTYLGMRGGGGDCGSDGHRRSG